MGRQRFLHHYLPAHLASALVAGALVEFMFNLQPVPVTQAEDQPDDPSGKSRAVAPRRFVQAEERMGCKSLIAAWIATLVILGATIWSFCFFVPLTYGTPGLDVAGVNARRWLGYDLHFAK